MRLDPDHVRARIAEWIWVPDEARTVETDEFLLIAYPAWFSDPTVATRWRSERPADDLIDDVLDAARGLGRESVNFFELSDTTRPPDLERRLRERGGAIRIEKSGRGRFRLGVAAPLTLEEMRAPPGAQA